MNHNDKFEHRDLLYSFRTALARLFMISHSVFLLPQLTDCYRFTSLNDSSLLSNSPDTAREYGDKQK